MSLKRINHGNENHTPGFVEDTGDTMTGLFNFGQLIIDADNVNAYIRAKLAKELYIGSNNTFQLSFGIAGGSNNSVGISTAFVLYPVQQATVSAPTFVEGGLYYDTTLHKLRVGGAADWETVTSS